MVEAKNTYNSGGLGTTGYEPFETPYGDNANENTGKGTGIGAGTGAQQPTTGQYGEVGGQGNVGVTGGHGHQGHSHHEGHHERQEHSHHTHDTTSGQYGQTAGGVTGTGHSHHHHHGQQSGFVGQVTEGGIQQGSYGNNNLSTGGATGNDRVGALNQNIGNYERTDQSGPTTTGAAGTDRFDSDRSRVGGVTGSQGVNQTSYGQDQSYPDGHFQTGERNLQGGDRKDGAVSGAAAVQPGAMQNAIGTSDKEFHDPARRATSGAYSDDLAHEKTALTGREGSANAASSEVGSSLGTNNSGQTVTENNVPVKTSMMDKIKEVLL